MSYARAVQNLNRRLGFSISEARVLLAQAKQRLEVTVDHKYNTRKHGALAAHDDIAMLGLHGVQHVVREHKRILFLRRDIGEDFADAYLFVLNLKERG